MLRLLPKSTVSFRTILVFLLVVLLFQPLLENNVKGTLILNLLFSTLLISGVLAVRKSRSLQIVAISIAVVAFVLRWLWYFEASHSEWVLSASIIADALFLGVICMSILRFLLTVEEVSVDTIASAIAVYFILGFAFGYIFSLTELLSPGSLNLPALVSTSDRHTSGFVYYSFVTLTTLGFGDATPVSTFARCLTIIEAVIGQMFLAILVARLVGIQIAREMKLR